MLLFTPQPTPGILSNYCKCIDPYAFIHPTPGILSNYLKYHENHLHIKLSN